MALRTLPSAVNTLLNDGTGFTYAHLVKFERPNLNTQFDVDQPTKYAYITDGSIDITWNGDTYFANKLKKIGNFTENSQASASNSTLTISALALGTSLTDTLTFNSSAGTVTGTKDFVEQGLAEGDTILFTASYSGQNDAKKFVITGFQSNNTVLVLDTIYDVIANETTTVYTLDLVSPELLGPVADRTATDYSNHINRQVFIYKALFDEETGLMVGDPFLMFKGIIAGAKLKQDPFKGSEISWSLTSHWGDFVRVNGRLTSDHAHRALKANGEPDKVALVDQRYANDFGFMHAEKAINLTAVYQVMETRYKEKKRGGLAGLVGLKKLQEYQVEVDREVDLRFNTSARRLPVVYGVQKIDAIPIFIDSDKNDSTNIYAAYAICEGQIAGIYDVHFNNLSTICVDANDSGARNSQNDNNNVEVVCAGRMDRGDTLSSSTLSGSQNVKGIDSQFNPADFNSALGTPDYLTYWTGSISKYDILADWNYGAITSPTGTRSGDLAAQLGIVDNQSAKFNPGIPTEIIFHAGKTRQKADPMLAKKGAAGEFKIQSDYSNTKTNYWGANHQLLDTAYVAVRYEIGEGETEIQPMEFVVKGKYLQCYNYDYSYSYNKLKNDTSAWDSFEVGSEYTLKAGDIGGSGSTIGTVRIADKYEIYNHAGNLDKRIRFHEDPEIGNNTTFYLDDGSSNYFYLETYNRTISSTSIAVKAELPVSTVTTNGSSTTDITLNTSSASTGQQALLALNQALMEMCLATSTPGAGFACAAFAQQLETTTVASNVITLPQNVTDEVSNLDKIVFADQLIVQSLNLSGGTNIDNGDYKIRLIYDDGAGDYKVQERTIIAHDTSPSGEDILTLDSEWESDYIPDGTSNYTYSIRSMGDLRVSLNPAAQLLDYLTNNRYGKGLTSSDLHISTFASTARTCDTNSDITVISTTSPSVGDYYYYNTNDNYFRGKVESKTARTVDGTTYYEVVFTDVIGKLGYKYLDWKTYNTGDLVWNDGKLYSWSSTLAGSSAAGTISLTKEGSSDTITLDTNSSNATVGAASGNYPKWKVSYEGNCLVKSYSDNNSFNGSGYSIYDADEVKYWRYMGWDHHDQRWATRHQLNTIIDTSNSIFDNINNILAQFNGILRYENGKYALGIKTAAPTLETVRYIDESDIIGEITVEDSGTKGSYNAMSLSFPDPQNKFSNRSITYTNSDYIKQDKGVTKSGSVSTPDITNYFNARIQATQYLTETRNNLKVSFTMVPEGIKLLAGTLIKLSNSKFGWVDKYFRIETLTFREDCLVDIDAEEHTDSAFLVTKEVSTTPAAFPPSSSKDEEPLPIPDAPTSLSYDSANNKGGVLLSWTNASSFTTNTWATEIWRSSTNNRANASVVGTSLGTSFTDPTTEDQDGVVYYWVRHSVETISRRDGKKRFVYSNFDTSATNGLQANVVSADVKYVTISGDQAFKFEQGSTVPTSTTITLTATLFGTLTTYDWEYWTGNAWANLSGTQTAQTYSLEYDDPDWGSNTSLRIRCSSGGYSDEITIVKLFDGEDTINIILSNEAHTLASSSTGTVTNYTGSGTTIRVFQGITELDYDGVGTAAGKWTVSASGSGIDNIGAISDSGTYATVADHSGMTVDNTVITYTITGKTAQGNSIGTLTKTQTLSKSKSGTGGRVVTLSTTKQVFVYDSSGNNPTGSATITATAHNLDSTGYYRFLKNGSEVQASSQTNTYPYTPATPITSMPEIIEVELRDGSASGSVVATDEMSLIGIQPGADVTTAILSNEAHTLPVTNQGVVTYTGSGTTIKVFQGATALAYKPTWNGNQAGKWIVTSTASNITRGDVQDSGNYATVDDHEDMDENATNASITYNITGRTFEGESFTIQKIQSFSKSVDGADGDPGDPGNNGDRGPQTVTGYLYYQLSSASAPTSSNTPNSSNTYGMNFSTGKFGTILNNWSHNPPTFAAGNANKYWYVFFGVEESGTYNPSTNTYSGETIYIDSQATQGIGFSGLVTFTSNDLTDGSSTYDPGTVINSGTTTKINGGRIETGSITALQIEGETITAAEIDGDTITANKLTNSNTNTSYNSNNNKFSIGNTGNEVDVNGTDYCATGYFYSSTTNCAAVIAEAGVNSSAAIVGTSKGNNTSGYGGFFGWSSTNNYSDSGKNKVFIGGKSYHILAKNGTTDVFSVAEDGSVISKMNITAYGTASDIRLKDNIEVIPNALEKVSELRGVTFDYKSDGKRNTGLIAQELEKVLPEAVYKTNLLGEYEEDKVLAIRYGNVVGLLVEAIKELKAEIEDLKRGNSE